VRNEEGKEEGREGCEWAFAEGRKRRQDRENERSFSHSEGQGGRKGGEEGGREGRAYLPSALDDGVLNVLDRDGLVHQPRHTAALLIEEGVGGREE